LPWSLLLVIPDEAPLKHVWWGPRARELGYPNSVLRKAGILVLSAALGAGAAAGVAACGEDREGDVRIEGGTTGTGKTETAKTATAEQTETAR
jgi:hypothetical protein